MAAKSHKIDFTNCAGLVIQAGVNLREGQKQSDIHW